MKELPKAYEAERYENNIYKRWEDSGFFDPDFCVKQGISKEDAPAFSIVLPPPNVTGTLHIGHAVMLAIEDVMIRYHRMKGDRTLWVPGTDHAAIATQEKVEKIMWNEEKRTRHDLGREAFLERVRNYARNSHDTIVNQAKRMGTSMDWSREYYSLDEKRNRAVRTAFKRMYDEGLIYRGDRIVNWDPKMQSNVSDIEVFRKEEKAPFYYFQYGPFEIGTARPETKFGDKYVVMHPDDERYKQYKQGDTFECEWINGPIIATVIKDEAVDPEFGSGVMTITPWHDNNDFFIAERHGLDKQQIIDLEGRLLSVAGEFAGMNILEARPKIVEKLKHKGLLTRVDETYEHSLAVNSRGGGQIEPQIMKQWWVDVDKKFKMSHSHINGIAAGQETSLKELMLHVVRSKQVDIVPERFEKTYFHWIEHLEDWCISRQIWFGHQVPAWYCAGEGACKLECKEPIVSIEDPKNCPHCGTTKLGQDPDTLDTWFSAGLFSFSPLGWPDFVNPKAGEPGPQNDLANYHPTSVLETGYDILFFWVARMILMSGFLLGEIPFKTVYLHGLVRDAEGRKMSKSLDNIIDPLDMCERYGTDATRLSLLIGSSPGVDSRLSEEKIAGFRNFTNKLWNISRFMLLNMEEPVQNLTKPEPWTLADRWILSELSAVLGQVSRDIELCRFSSAGEALRDFTWNKLADWYLEISKVEKEEHSKSDILNFILNTLLKLWHPYMPFVTERIWEEVYGDLGLLMVEKWPAYSYSLSDKDQRDFQLLQSFVVALRSFRAEQGLGAGAFVKLRIGSSTSEEYHNIQTFFENESKERILNMLARVESIAFSAPAEVGDASGALLVGPYLVYIGLGASADKDKLRERIKKEMDKLLPYVDSMSKKLSNPAFMDKAPQSVVDLENEKFQEAKKRVDKLSEQLGNLNI